MYLLLNTGFTNCLLTNMETVGSELQARLLPFSSCSPVLMRVFTEDGTWSWPGTQTVKWAPFAYYAIHVRSFQNYINSDVGMTLQNRPLTWCLNV